MPVAIIFPATCLAICIFLYLLSAKAKDDLLHLQNNREHLIQSFGSEEYYRRQSRAKYENHNYQEGSKNALALTLASAFMIFILSLL